MDLIEEDLIWFKQYMAHRKVSNKMPEVLEKRLSGFIEKVEKLIKKVKK